MLPKYRPPTHPGEILLEEFLKPLNISQSALARHLGWPYARLNEIINGKRGVTAVSALDLGEALLTGPEFWLNLQRDWDLWHSKQKHHMVKLLPDMVNQVSMQP
jgi:addiction module HigA family antidote